MYCPSNSSPIIPLLTTPLPTPIFIPLQPTLFFSSTAKPSYSDNTVASVGKKTTIKENHKIEEETVKVKGSSYFEPETPYTGDQTIFLNF